MKIDRAEMCKRIGVRRPMLQAWIAAGWIHAPGANGAAAFTEMDLARAQLIRDLAGPMGINADGIAVILDLVDQIHGLRQALRGLSVAIAAQDLAVRRRIWSDAARRPGLHSGATSSLAPGPRSRTAM